MTDNNYKLRVFLCHDSQDKSIVRELSKRLVAEGWIEPWLDEEQILPGQDWNMEIEKAVEAADAVIVCISDHSVSKEGYLQKEIMKVLDVSDQKPEGTIFLIPLRLQDCQPPRRLMRWQYLSYFPPEQREAAYQRLLKSLKERADKLADRTKLASRPLSTPPAKPYPRPSRNDHHTAVVAEKLAEAASGGVKFVTAKLRWGKDDVGYSVHAGPYSYTTSGMQTTDFLSYLGFTREVCPYIDRRECYAAWIDGDFDLTGFTNVFDHAYGLFAEASKLLERCGHILDQPEGWAYHYGKPSSGTDYRSRLGYSADGHTAPKSEKLKQSDDVNFLYALSWIAGPSEKGWVFHYRPKPEANPRLLSALPFLHLREFKECPHFDFDTCRWRFVQHQSRGDDFFETNARQIHGAFEAHAALFSEALEKLVRSNDFVTPFGLGFLK